MKVKPAMLELLVLAHRDRREVSILVPKRRGTGYLVMPLGHHKSPLDDIAHEIGFDIYGLDGSLDVQTGYVGHFDKEELLARIMTPICEHYGMTYREVEEGEFWDVHPIKRSDAFKDIMRT